MINKMDFMVALYIFGVMTAELLGAKIIPLGAVGSLHLSAGVAIFVMPLLFTVTDVVVEVYGVKRARSMVWCGVITAVLLIAYTTLATHLPASARFAHQEAAYESVFGSSARVAAASLAAFVGSEFLDVLVFAKLRAWLHDHALWLRNNASNFVSQFADATIFLTLAFYSLDQPFSSNVSFLTGIIMPYWLVRCILSIIETPLVYVGVVWLRGGLATNLEAA